METEQKKSHHLTENDMRMLSVVYDALLFLSAVIIVFGYLESSYFLIGTGIAAVVMSVIFLELLWKAKHHINRRRKEREDGFWI